MKNIPYLSHPELERLAILSEELAEAQQIIGKILRHGYESSNPFDPDKTSNRNLLEYELGHVAYAIQLMFANSDISEDNIDTHAVRKVSMIKSYLHHNDNVMPTP